MKRRSFLSNIGLGSIALGAAPALTTCNTPSHSKKEDALPLDDDYTLTDRARSGIALGGIGTGSVELRPDGTFR
ncbi:MAG: hypothetical protein ACOC10_08025 [Bacteroidota bacterium]